MQGRHGLAEGQLVRRGVLPVTRMRNRGDRLEAHMDLAWLVLRSHPHTATRRIHSGELGVVEVERERDDARSGITRTSRGSKGP